MTKISVAVQHMHVADSPRNNQGGWGVSDPYAEGNGEGSTCIDKSRSFFCDKLGKVDSYLLQFPFSLSCPFKTCA